MEEDANKIKDELAGTRVHNGSNFFNLHKELQMIDGAGFLETGSWKCRVTSDHNKLYLDLCATNHAMFAQENLDHIHVRSETTTTL